MDDVFFGSSPGIASSCITIPRVLQVIVRTTDEIQEEIQRGISLEDLYQLRVEHAPPDANGLPISDVEADTRSRAVIDEQKNNITNKEYSNIAHTEQEALREIFQKEDSLGERMNDLARQRRQRRVEEALALRSISTAHARLMHQRCSKSQRSFDRAPVRAVLPGVAKKPVHTAIRSETRDILPIKQSVKAQKPVEQAVVRQKIRTHGTGKKHRHAEVRAQRDQAFKSWWNGHAARGGRKKDREALPWMEAFRVAVASAAAAYIISMLGSFAALPSNSSVIAAIAGNGADHLRAGMTNMLALDVTAGKQEFSAAAEQFQAAEEKLYETTTTMQRILARLDPAARYSSGKSLLEAGKRLASLEEEASAVVTLFLPDSGDDEPLTKMLERRMPAITELAEGLKEVEQLLDDVRVDALPEELREEFITMVFSLRALSGAVSTYVDSQEVLLELLGGRVDRTYLVLFQNNRELRASGGFIGSFALIRVSEGNVENINVDTIYNPDGQLRDYITPPKPLQKITDRWYTRDANWFAHFPYSARKISSLFERSGGPTVDGVLTVTPEVLKRMLEITGDISMPEYGITVTSENVIDETQRLTTFDYDRSVNQPKAFVADLLPEVLDRLTDAGIDQHALLVTLLGEALEEKHILIWFRNLDAQDLVRRLGWGGIVADAPNSDYLMRVTSNIGGHKTDHLIDMSVQYEVHIDANGSATATLVTTRHHTGSKHGRPGVHPDEDWVSKPNVVYERLLVPRGSRLIEARGFTNESLVPVPFENTADYRAYEKDEDLVAIEETARVLDDGTRVAEEAGKTTFENWIITQPGETTVTAYTYQLPMNYETRTISSRPFSYRLFVQRQPGHTPVTFTSAVRLPSGFSVAYAGPEDAARVEQGSASFTTTLSRDMVMGIVAERL